MRQSGRRCTGNDGRSWTGSSRNRTSSSRCEHTRLGAKGELVSAVTGPSVGRLPRVQRAGLRHRLSTVTVVYRLRNRLIDEPGSTLRIGPSIRAKVRLYSEGSLNLPSPPLQRRACRVVGRQPADRLEALPPPPMLSVVHGADRAPWSAAGRQGLFSNRPPDLPNPVSFPRRVDVCQQTVDC